MTVPPAPRIPDTQARDAGLQPEAAALAAAPISIMLFGADLRLRFANAEARRQLGLPPETDLVGRTTQEIARLCAFRGLYGPGDPEILAERMLNLDRSKPMRRTVRGQDGRWFDISSEPLPDGGHATYAVDVTAHRRGEMEAMERTRMLEMALRHLHTGFGLFDPGHRLLRHNDAYEQVLGLMPGSLRTGMTVTEVHGCLLEQHGFSSLLDTMEQRSSLDRSQPHDEVRPMPDGRVVRNVSRPLPTGGFLVTLEDVTALRQLEDEARHRAATLRGVLAALPYGICVFDAHQRLTMVNEAYQQILKGAELRVGDHLLDICREREAMGEYPPGVTGEEIYRRQFQFGQPPRLRIRADGTVLNVRNAPLPDGGHINVVADVTALHQAEADAKRRADLLQAMLDNMRHGVCLFDRDLRVVALNGLAVGMSGLRADEMVPGALLSDLRDLQHARGEFGAGTGGYEAYRARLGTERKRHDRYTRTRADGTVIEVSTDPTPDGGFVRTYADITGERRVRAALEAARQAAEDANSAKTRFLATMSHELRTPLNAVIGFSEALIADERRPAEDMEFAGAILDAGRHLLSLIDDILQVAQINSGEIPVETRALHLPSVLESAMRLVRSAACAAGVTLTLEPLPDALPRAMAEERRLRQILLNLLSNAVKFTPPGGSVSISASVLPGGGVELAVRDSGIGIEPADLPRAFEPFVQLETAHDRRYGGSGLGLYLAQAFSRAMGAGLTLESARGEGTTARLRLAPAAPQEKTA
ncbi:MAG: hypothetical protein JWP20_1661 [Roseomonas sp.]|nr:hypothetical protein [Roseomonas sp.]